MTRALWRCLPSIALGAFCATAAVAADEAALKGVVLDPIGGRVASASVRLLREGTSPRETSSNTQGEFAFEGVVPGRYRIEAVAPGFELRVVDPLVVTGASVVRAEVVLPIGMLEQNVLVTAAAAEVLPSQTGAAATVIDQQTIDALAKPDVLESLRIVPGSQVVQTGGRGGTASMFIRGGNANFNKLLIDGIAANDIGGTADVSNYSNTGIERVEVLREANSVLFGSDALGGVISITTRRGRTRIPEATYAIDGGNLGTIRQSGGVGGASGRFDYFGEVSRFQTDNSVPNNKYTNNTFAGRVGVALGHSTDLSGTVRFLDRRFESPGATALSGIADDASQTDRQAFIGLTLQSQMSDRMQAVVRFGSTDLRTRYDNPTPTGQPFDPYGYGANFLGKTVTVTGANGYSTTGRAILDYGGTFPSIYQNKSTRQALSGQTTAQLLPDVSLSVGAHYDREEGFPDPDQAPTTTRNNGGLFVEGRTTLAQRLTLAAGLGYEHNAVFKSAATPRVSAAYYLRAPSGRDAVGDTKLTFNAGTGIKAPTTYQADSSLFTVLTNTASGATLVSNAGIGPIGPERSRTVSVGLEQGLARGRARARVAYFDNEFFDLIEYVSNTVLPRLGVSKAAADATGYGAYVNSQSYKARGVELSFESSIRSKVRAAASYTYLAAEVTKSLSGGALEPSVNPAFPGIQIGQYSPLVGARPFRRPAHSGNLLLTYTEGAAQVALAGYFVGKSDDSTFLSDGYFGNSMLLPNKDLLAGYQKIDLSGSYRLNSHVRWFVSVENLFDQKYEASFGHPALPRTARTGVTLRVGGDRGKP